MKSVCVFCGSSPGAQPAYLDAARAVGTLLADRGHTLVYGGGRVGLMGAVADAALAAGGRVIGVIPASLAAKEVAHGGLSELRVVGSMHERKAQMVDLSDCFLALPGGFGTLEELFEVVTWAQIGIHRKPCGLLSVGGYFDLLLDFADHALDQRFVRPEHRSLLLTDTDAAVLLDRMALFHSPIVDKWMDRDET
ncbi:MAG TPA: TIGR00730 family Rossman fold protein [Chthonomonadaceae bacterium]|nr:TIGR00730 family Rossman fold protein [Chthonomonadaceae bacterium]